MSEIFKQYSQAILTSIAFTLIVALLFTSWMTGGDILSYVGSRTETMLEERNIDYTGHLDKQNFMIHAARRVPTIQSKAHVKEKTTFNLVDAFLIKDTDGYVWNDSLQVFEQGGNQANGVVEVLSIKDSNGVEYLENSSVYNQTSHMVTFPKVDTYMVRMRLMDYDNVEATYTVPLAVDLLVT